MSEIVKGCTVTFENQSDPLTVIGLGNWRENGRYVCPAALCRDGHGVSRWYPFHSLKFNAPPAPPKPKRKGKDEAQPAEAGSGE